MTARASSAAPARTRALAAAVATFAADARAGMPGALHDLRVACRRLEVALRLWSRRRPALAARRRVRALRQAAGPARELEVVAEALRLRRSGAGVIPGALRKRWLAALRRRPVGTGDIHLPGEHTVRAFTAETEQAASTLESERTPVIVKRATARRQAWRRRAEQRLAHGLGSGDVEALHRARLAIKRWRYAEELLAAAPDRSPAVVPELRRWQRVLGELNDRALLVAFAAAQGPRGQACARRLEVLRLEALRRLRATRGASGAAPRPQA